jgi:ATPase
MVGRYSIKSEEDCYVPDTSVIINGGLKNLLEEEKIESTSKIIIHAALISELEHQANIGQKTGLTGFNELIKIRELCKKQDIFIEYGGRRPRSYEIKSAKSGEIDALIRDFSQKAGAILVTSDFIQNLSANSLGIKTLFIETEIHLEKTLQIEKYFDTETMSIHLKQGCPVYVKRGTPGRVQIEKFNEEKCSKQHLIHLAEEIIKKAHNFEDTFVEINRPGSTIVQYDDIRIVICKPPFSDGWEITAVRPLVKLALDDYTPSPNLYKRLEEKAEGVLVAGSPGAGKTTFTRALALFYESTSKVIKTIESPRDLDLKAEITQYSKNFGTHTEIHDILLLSRPDYTIFDEIRDTEDFKLYTDLRLAGIGLVGVIHSSTAIDAIQRFIGRVELGVIPSVLDTIIYIKAGKISRVLEVKMTVKVPTGLMESDLARPVIEVRDFETNEIEYEMYTFGEQTVVIPLKDENRSQIKVDARTIQNITDAIEQYTAQPIVLIPKDLYGKRFEIQCSEYDIPTIVGRGGGTIRMLEKAFNVKLDINKSKTDQSKDRLAVLQNKMLSIRKKMIIISFPKRMKNKNIQFYMINRETGDLAEIFAGTTSKSSKIKLSTRSEAGQIIRAGIEEDNEKILWKEY